MDHLWPERLTLVIALIIVAVLWFFGATAGPIAGDFNARFDAFLSIFGTIAMTVLVPIWAILRAIDLGRPQRHQ